MKQAWRIMLGAALVGMAARVAAFPLWLDDPARNNSHDPRSTSFNTNSTRTATPTNVFGNPTSTPVVTATPTSTNPAGTFTFSSTPTATPTPAACPPYWNFDNGSLQGWVNSTGDTGFTNVVSNTTMPHDGSNSLAVTCSLAQGGSAVAGVIYYNPPSTLDLSGKTLTAWIYVPAGMSNASNPTGVYIYVKTGAGWTWNQGPWTNLPSTAGWTQISYNLNGVASINDVKEIGVKVNLGGSSPNWSGTIYIDSIDYGVCLPTPTPTPTVGGIVWNFDNGTLQGWVNSTGDTGFTNVVSNTTMPHDGSNSLDITCSLAQGGSAVAGVIYYNPSSTLDLTGKILTAWVYVPAGMSNASNPTGAYLYVKTGSAWTWSQGSWQNLPSTAGWTQISFDVSAVANINDVKEVGVKISLGGSSPNWSGTIYVDSITY